MATLNETLAHIRQVLQDHILDEVSKEPVQRAKDRMRDAWKRGGFKKLLTATKVRINATKNPEKLKGIVIALGQVIKDDEFPLTPAQEKELHDLVSPAIDKHKWS